MSHLPRRDFLRNSAALAAGTAVLRGAPALAASSSAPLPTPLEQLPYAAVQLLPGPLLTQFQQNHALFLALDDDRLLKPFRQAAGLPAPGDDMGGWYTPSPFFDPPRNMTGYIPGHSFGQYLSGLARAFAVTGDPATQAKVHGLTRAFAATVTPRFYQGYCLPCYTFDKTNCGLIDAHQFAADPLALGVLNHATDAVLPWLPPKALTHDDMEARPHPNVAYTWDEPYTLPENLYLAYTRGAGPRFLELARRFLQDGPYFDPLAAGQNVLPGLHAYSHVNALSSAVQAYLVDASAMHLQAARNGFAFVQQQSFATGGWGPDEGFRHPSTDELAHSLTATHNSFETPCGAYGHFKITRYLLRITGDSTFGDSMEAVLYNTILGARPIQPDGTSFYYSDYSQNAWAGPQTRLAINGHPISIPPRPRPLGHRLPPLAHRRSPRALARSAPPPRPLDPQHPELVALLRGPVALFALDPNPTAPPLTRAQLLAATTSTGDTWQVATSTGTLRFVPFPAITTEPYRLYHQL